MISSLLYILVIFLYFCAAQSLSSSPTKEKYYNYFAFGSNMASSTMTALRNVTPVASTAAVVPNHRLAFNVPGTPLIEPSWASIEPSDSDDNRDVCHGVLYKLTEEDFQVVCETEGVPFGYTLHRCRAVPYKGNGDDAGIKALDNGSRTVAAFTLRASRKEWREGRDIPPSRAYLNILIRGAQEFGLDGEYVDKLREISPGRTIGNGVAEYMLQVAERRASFRPIGYR